MSDVVYHFASTENLPWILADGELRPTMCVDVGIGRTTFLWGSTNPAGDLTAAPFRSLHRNPGPWRNGEFLLARFTLPANAFLTWNEIQQFENWEPDEIAALIESDRRLYGDVDHNTWRLRRDPLRLADVIQVETTGYEDHETETWHPFDFKNATLLRPPCEYLHVLLRSPYTLSAEEDPIARTEWLGLRIGGREFVSVRGTTRIHGLDFTRAWTDDDHYAVLYELRRRQEEADADAEYEEDDEDDIDAEFEGDDIDAE